MADAAVGATRERNTSLPTELELGLGTFGDVTLDANDRELPMHQVLRNVVAEAVLADRLGVDFIGLGEHHRRDYAISAPDVVLAAIAGRTERIRLGSAVTVLSSDDPVRVFQRFATLDAISDGRAEVILGRGSFIESFPLFGYDLRDYEVLFEEKLDLFAELLKEQPVTWSGTKRAAVPGLTVYPHTESGRLRTWIGVGGTPQSVVRAARYGLPMVLAIIGGNPLAFRRFVDIYHRALEQFGREQLPVGLHSHGFIAETDQEALDGLWPYYKAQHDRIGAERGWPPTNRAAFEQDAGPDGALYAGSPETVAQKIARNLRGIGATRFDMKYSYTGLPHELALRTIELYGTRVIPRVRELLA